MLWTRESEEVYPGDTLADKQKYDIGIDVLCFSDEDGGVLNALGLRTFVNRILKLLTFSTMSF